MRWLWLVLFLVPISVGAAPYQQQQDWPPPQPNKIIDLSNNSLVDVTNTDYAAWLALGGAPLAAKPLGPDQEMSKRLTAGIAITSLTAPSLNGTYRVHPNVQPQITAIYTGIRSGDGLPGNGPTFNYQDQSGTMHAFTEVQFLAFAKAVRDYVYALGQAAAAPNPVWPSNAVTLP